jgi:hypothetical protein
VRVEMAERRHTPFTPRPCHWQLGCATVPFRDPRALGVVGLCGCARGEVSRGSPVVKLKVVKTFVSEHRGG